MAVKIEITQKQKSEIIKLYTQNNLSLRKIGKLVGNFSQTFIEKILKQEGVYKNLNGIISKKQEDEKIEDNFLFVAICKITGKEFDDYKNSSGLLTEYLKNNFKEIEHPSNYHKRNYKTITGKYWHEQYFNIIQKEKVKKDTKKCAYCNWETIDIENKSGMYLTHLKKEHNVDLECHLKKFPQDENYFEIQFIKLQKEKIKNKENINYVICKICNKKFRKISNTHLLNKHNITAEEYKQKFYNSLIVCDETKKYSVDIYNKVLKHKENKFISSHHVQIADYIKELGFEIKNNDKKLLNGTEIDILINSLNLGIEFNGCFYHTEKGGKKEKKYHLNKTLLMNENNYSLIHLFEDEWVLKKEIVKSKIAFILKKFNGEKIHARKCIIKEINPTLKNLFLEKNHIQGKESSKISLGAYYNNNLISVMTFDNSRGMSMGNKNDKNCFELTRFCADLNYKITGIAGKLLSYFIKNYNPIKIISFADRRWTLDKENNLYTKLGFKLTKILSPDYTYYNPRIHRFKRFHKFSFGKSSLKKKFPEIYNDKKTEWEMMQELGYDRIWDCGKFKYELSF